MKIAVVLFAYNRPEYLRMTLEGLSGNNSSADFPLYIYCDGPKEGALVETTQSIEEVRRVARTASGFSSVHVVESNANKGLAASVIGGVSEVLEDFDAVIVFEDDIISSPNTLDYLRNMLIKYQDVDSVISVTSYSYPEKTISLHDGYEFNNFFLMRPCSWGWATWKERWQEVDWDALNNIAISAQDCREFDRYCGADVSRMFKKQLSGKIDSWAIRFTYHAYKTNRYCSYPRFSYISNIGSDGSGTHRGLNADYIENKELCHRDLADNLAQKVEVDRRIFFQFDRFVRKRYYLRRLAFEIFKIFNK